VAAEFLHALLPEHLLLGLLFVLMVLEMLRVDARAAGVLMKLTLAAACVLLLRQYATGYSAEVVPEEIRVDGFAVLAKLVILGCGLLWCLLLRRGITFKAAFLASSSLLGASIVMDSAGFAPLFIGIELLSLPAFALMVHGAGASAASEGAFKYLLLSSVATALLLFGIALAYGVTGSLAIEGFAAALGSGSNQAAAAGVLIASGFFLKAAVFPFHGWAPDAYASARLPVMGFLASVVKGTVVLALVRILSSVVLDATIVPAIGVLAVASIYFGNITAIRQHAFRRLLAYSSIAHAGYMLFAFVDQTGARPEDLLWYVAIYAATVIVAAAAFEVLCPGDTDDVRSLDGTFQAHPFAAAAFGLAMLSLAGIPPLPGFFAKLFIFKSVIASGYLVSAVIAFVGSFIGVTYYLGLFFRLFAAEAPAEDAGSSSVGKG
jgi:NADH-quinone oxidoreductase subunit N